jgi:hypothetical protein
LEMIRVLRFLRLTDKQNQEMNYGSQNVLGVLTWIGGY